MEKDEKISQNSRKYSLSVKELLKSNCPEQKYDSKFIDKWYSPTDRKSKVALYNRKMCKSGIPQKENEKTKIIPFVCKSNKNMEYFDINFRRIKNCLKSSCQSSKFKVLQAIRWRLTKSNQEIQEKTLRDIKKYDLFNLGHSKSILEELLWPINVMIPHPLQVR